MRGEGGRPDIAWSAHTYRIRQVAKQDARARSVPQLSMFLQLAVISIDVAQPERGAALLHDAKEQW